MSYSFTEISVPAGSFFSWGSFAGQKITGKVLSYSPTAGSDFNDEPCPQITLELVEPAKSISKDNIATDFAKGELVTLNTGQAGLRRAIIAADLSAGDILQIELTGTVKVAKGTAKEFAVRVARGAGSSTTSNAAPAPSPNPFGGATVNPFANDPAPF